MGSPPAPELTDFEIMDASVHYLASNLKGVLVYGWGKQSPTHNLPYIQGELRIIFFLNTHFK